MERTINNLGALYKAKRKELRTEINKAKSAAWQELISSIDQDPWGLPYKIVLKILKSASLSLTEVLEPEILTDLLDSLFPKYNLLDPIKDWSDFVWLDEWSVAPAEVLRAVKKNAPPSKKAPGPDGFRSTIWKKVTGEVRLRSD